MTMRTGWLPCIRLVKTVCRPSTGEPTMSRDISCNKR